VKNNTNLIPYILEDNIPEQGECAKLKFLMYWLRGNQFIENQMKRVFHYRIEDMHYRSESLLKLGEILGFEVPEDFSMPFQRMHGETGPEPWSQDYEWPDISESWQRQLTMVKMKAKKYGYSIGEI
jgi:hypothetical protein